MSTEQAGRSRVTAAVTDPDGRAVDAEVVTSKSSEGVPAEIRFTPKTIGQYQINVFYGDAEVADSPIALSVEDADKPRAYGPGLEHAIVNSRTTILFDSRKGKGSLKVEIYGPSSRTKFESKKKNEGVYEINFTPIEPGPHKVHITWKDKPVQVRYVLQPQFLQGSPFTVPVIDPNGIRYLAGGVNDKNQLAVTANMVKEVVVDVSLTGASRLEATLADTKSSKIVQVPVEPQPGQVYKLRVKAPTAGEHILALMLDGVPLTDGSSVVCWAEPSATGEQICARHL